MTSSPELRATARKAPKARAAPAAVPAASVPGPGLTLSAARELTLDAMFARAARAHPDRTAVRVAGGRLTYRGAEQRARQLASLLVLSGVQLGDPVLVRCVDHRRSVVAQLAVLKAGGVCVPVPAGACDAELRAAAELSGAQAVLCGAADPAARLPVRLVLCLDDEKTWNRAAASRPDDSLPRSSPVDPAYLLVGPAGPDGSREAELIDHQAWQLASAARILRVGAADHGVEIRQRPGTPVALTAMWWAFASAAPLYCGPQNAPLTRAPVTVLDPGEYDRLLVPMAAGPRVVLLLGEPCPRELAERHRAVLPGSRLWAEFVPSPGALPWAARELSRAEAESWPARRRARWDGRTEPVCVGDPVQGVWVQVLDATGFALAAGLDGEVCAAGPALAFDRVRGAAGDAEAPEVEPDPVTGPVFRSGLVGRRSPEGRLVVYVPAPAASVSAVDAPATPATPAAPVGAGAGAGGPV